MVFKITHGIDQTGGHIDLEWFHYIFFRQLIDSHGMRNAGTTAFLGLRSNDKGSKII